VELEYQGVAPIAGGLTVDVAERDGAWTWSVANESRVPMAVERVALTWRVRATGDVRGLRNGWQSWSAAEELSLSSYRDPSLDTTAPGLWRAMHHADDEPVPDGEFRSELVTVLSDDNDAMCIGFDGGDRHDGTIRVLDGVVAAEAVLGGAVLEPGQRRELHRVRIAAGDLDELLDDWAAWAGDASGARVRAPYVAGWCSWYHYFHGITEAALRENLALASALPLGVFQLDDGYQSAIGDWLTTVDTFPSGLPQLADDVAEAGYRPGIWIAPFLASPTSQVAAAHDGWLARRPSGRRMIGMVNEGWGGEQYVLDTTHPDVLEHLEGLAGELVGMGFTYLKLDFTYAPSFRGTWHDPSRTPAERVRAGYDAVRRGAGNGAFILGCGAPLGACIGAVDGMRVGPDVAPFWAPRASGAYAETAPALANAYRNTVARSFMHRRLWLNDPDCLMLRRTATELDDSQIDAWADLVATSGQMALISDDLSLLDAADRRRFADVVETGRAVDAVIQARCDEPSS
jgi:alpha-galactosidase